jgi:hypothetical protein
MHLDYDRHADEVTGFADLGDDKEDDSLAREALVFMAVGVKEKWKMPLAYFFVDCLSGANLSRLISQTIVRLNDTGSRVLAVTLDGSAINCSAMRHLGCKLCEEILHSFPHPSDPTKLVYVYWDPCHMLKLLRNMLGEWKVLYTKWGPVRWQHIVGLHEYQVREGISAANKLSERHIAYERQKMKVRIMQYNRYTVTIYDKYVFTIDFIILTE